jgi:hypothetical protein
LAELAPIENDWQANPQIRMASPAVKFQIADTPDQRGRSGFARRVLLKGGADWDYIGDQMGHANL